MKKSQKPLPSYPAPVKLNPGFPLKCSKVALDNPSIDFMHIHNTLEIGLCLEGQGRFVVEKKVFSFKEGDVFVINHLEMHRACHPDHGRSLWYFIMADPLQLFRNYAKQPFMDTARLAGSEFTNRWPKGAHPGLHELVQKIVSESEARNEHYQESIRALLALALIELDRMTGPGLSAGQGPVSRRTTGLMERLSPAVDRITRDFGEPLSIGDLARDCCMAESHFRRLFVSAFVQSPLDYLNEYRIAVASSLLSTTNRSIADIALSCGFSTLSSFNRQFRKRRMKAPREMRKGDP